MTKYVCEDCGAIFDEPEVKRWTENHGSEMQEAWAIPVCPECGSEEFEEIENDEFEED